MGAVASLGWAGPPASVMAQILHSACNLYSVCNPFLISEPEINMTATLTANSTTSAPLTAAAMAEIDAYLEAYYQTQRFSGSIIVTLGDQAVVTRSHGLANREHGVENTPDTKFRIGSITKQFTAVAILQLQEQGLLDVQAPISTYLPDYPEGDRVTIHHLLTHTAGIPEYLNLEVFPDLIDWMRLPATLDQIVNRFKDLPLEFEPGSQYKYSNSGYVLLTKIMETVSGQPYADYMQTHIFEPLGMENTGYEIPKAVIPKLAQGYLSIGPEIHLQAEPIDMSIPQGAGGLYSTVEDLAKWNQWLYGPNTDQTVLSQAAISTLTTPVIQWEASQYGADAFYGYGLVLDSHLGRQRINHGGGISGFSSYLAYYPEETLTVAVLSNFENASSGPLAVDLAAIVFGEPYEIPKPPEIAAINPAVYARYVGAYQLTPEMQVSIRVEAGQLVGQATGQDSFVLYPSSETDFFAQVADVTLTFSLSEDGRVNGFTFRQLGQELFAPKIDE